jgi:hypothetical protein
MKRERQRETKNQKTPTKIEPLNGHLEHRMVRCGKANCKCAKGELHGPYYLRRWRIRGKKRAEYVKKSEFQTISAACLAYKRDRQETRELIRGINESGNALLRAMREMLRGFQS